MMLIAYLANYNYKTSVVEQNSGDSEYKAGKDIDVKKIIK